MIGGAAQHNNQTTQDSSTVEQRDLLKMRFAKDSSGCTFRHFQTWIIIQYVSDLSINRNL